MITLDTDVVNVENLLVMLLYPIINNLDKLDDMFQTINSSSIPSKFTVRYWSKLGFSSSQDRDFINLLKFLGYIDENSIPTNYFQQLKDVSFYKSSIAERVKVSYSAIFDINPYAFQLPAAEIAKYISSFSTLSLEEINKQALTFTRICQFSDFSLATYIKDSKQVKDLKIENSKPRESQIVFNINLPTCTDPEVYKAIFENLQKIIT